MHTMGLLSFCRVSNEKREKARQRKSTKSPQNHQTCDIYLTLFECVLSMKNRYGVWFGTSGCFCGVVFAKTAMCHILRRSYLLDGIAIANLQSVVHVQYSLYCNVVESLGGCTSTPVHSMQVSTESRCTFIPMR